MKFSIDFLLIFCFFRNTLELLPLNSSLYTCGKSSTNLIIGDQVFLCIHNFETSKRIAFPIIVDQYTMLTITGGYLLADKSIENQMSFLAQIGYNITAFNSKYYQRNKYIFPLFNLVVKVNKGNITDLVWVNDCYSCLNTEECIPQRNISSLFFNNSSNITFHNDNNCATKLSSCSTNYSSAFYCDPKFYVTWFGTDMKGKPLQSANLSMEKFRQYSIGSLYSSAFNIFNNTITDIVNTYNNVESTIVNMTKPNTSRNSF